MTLVTLTMCIINKTIKKSETSMKKLFEMLLDNQSTCDVIVNPAFLSNI